MFFAKYGLSCFAVLSCTFNIFAQNKFIAAVVYTLDGKGDKGFCDSAWEGVTLAKSKLDIEIKEIEPGTVQNREKQMEIAAIEGIPMVIAVGFDQSESITKVAAKFPKTHFVLIDGGGRGDNILNINFKEHEGSFLAGYASAMTTKSNKLGFIGALPEPLIIKFGSGFVQGAKAFNKNITVDLQYMGKAGDYSMFNNAIKAKEMARKMYAEGVDIVYSAAGGSGLGIIEAAKETKKYAVGVDVNQNNVAPGFVITSMLKRVDIAVFDSIKAEKEGTYKHGMKTFGIKEDGLDLAIDENAKKLLPKNFLDKFADLKKEIASGKIVVSEK